MPYVSHLFFKSAVLFLIAGIAVGLHMAISQDHTTFPAHAHINLLGWVTSALFGGYYALNPAKAERRIAIVHFLVYTVGLVVMLPALYIMFLGHSWLEPLVAAGSLIVAAGVLIFASVVFSGGKERATALNATLAAR